MELPEDWELLQFSRERSEGRIAFADRYQFRFEFSWRVIGGRPDMQRLTNDYLAKVRVENDDRNARTRNVGPWHGLRTGEKAALSTRFSRYFPQESCLVESVFLWPDGVDVGVERKTLDSIGEERQTSPNRKRWRAFGMDALASSDLVLAQCLVEPARAQLKFVSSTGRRREEQYERLGMVPEWMKCSVREWLVRHVPKAAVVEAENGDSVRGHEIQTLRCTSYANGMARLLGRKTYHEVAAWLCPVDGRLYSARLTGQEAPPSEDLQTLAGGRLSCCGDVGPGT
jgi:hypothetical protein